MIPSWIVGLVTVQEAVALPAFLTTTVLLLIGAATGAAFGLLLWRVFVKMPDTWLEETPEEQAETAASGRSPILADSRRGLAVFFAASGTLCTALAAASVDLQGRPLWALLPAWCVLAGTLIWIAAADLRRHIIPDQLLLLLVPAYLLRHLAWLAGGPADPGSRFDLRRASVSGSALFGAAVRDLASGLAVGAVLLAIAWLTARLLGQEAIGIGDVKLMAAGGLFCGWPLTFWLFVLTFILAALPSLPLLIARAWRRTAAQNPSAATPAIALGPFIALSILLLQFFEPWARVAAADLFLGNLSAWCGVCP